MNNHILGIVCGIGAILMTIYNLWVISKLSSIVSISIIIGICLCEILYGIGLALCLFGIRKPFENNR